jgi:hypothetical protein
MLQFFAFMCMMYVVRAGRSLRGGWYETWKGNGLTIFERMGPAIGDINDPRAMGINQVAAAAVAAARGSTSE